MLGTTDKHKVQYILPCLSCLVQEMVAPYLDPSLTWAEVKEALLAEFGSRLGLHREKQAFMHLSMYEGEPFIAFAEPFYLAAQRLSTSNMLTLDDAIAALLTGLSYPSLARGINSVKRHFKSIRDLKEALVDVADFHSCATPKIAEVKSSTLTIEELPPVEQRRVSSPVTILPAKPVSLV